MGTEDVASEPAKGGILAGFLKEVTPSMPVLARESSGRRTSGSRRGARSPEVRVEGAWPC